MFKCANDECDSTIKPGDKPTLFVTKERTVAYAESGILLSTGKEIVEELPFCRICSEIIRGMELEPSVIGHKVIDKIYHAKSGKHLRTEIHHYAAEEEVPL